jgi:hypothetical protein
MVLANATIVAKFPSVRSKREREERRKKGKELKEEVEGDDVLPTQW